MNSDWRYRLAHFSDSIYLVTSKVIKILLLSHNKSIRIWQSFFNIFNKNALWKKARFLTWPLHKIWTYYYVKIVKRKKEEYDIIDSTEGLQIISGNTGSGKSTLGFDIIEKDLLLNNKPWYVNTLIEKPRYYTPLEAYVRFHRYIPFNKVWSDYKMKLQLSNDYGGYLLDELHRIFDYRLNQTNEYLSKFVPFRDYSVLIRKHIKKIVGLTQMDRLDIQLMYLVKLWHKPRIDIGFDYEDWLIETGLFRFKIKGWFIDTYVVDTSNPSNMLILYKTWYRKSSANFDYFDTYAFNDVYNHLPKDNPNIKYS
ncbi:MAG: hypothetical protein RBQ97_03690 [Acholeplasma sp.]|nr:hypothetical protein [Acholeplasma sp.]